MKASSVDFIEHKAIVAALSEKERTVTVVVEHADECGGCPAARLCNLNNDKSDRLVISDPRPERFKVGERVMVCGRESLHRRAIMLCTVIPCVMLVFIMSVIFIATYSQTAAALGGLGSMIFFFLLLYLGRNKIAHDFTFTIQKL